MRLTTTMAVAGLMIAGFAGAACAASSSASSSSSSSDMSTAGCKTVHLKPGENPPTGMSTSINAGNGQVSGHTTVGGGGTGVSVSSGTGASVSSGSGANSTSMSTSSNGKMTKVTSSDGGCTVYIRD